MSAFRDAVAAAVDNTPYTVVDTKKGFNLQLDVVDTRWWGLFAREGLSSSFSWRVTERPSSYTISDRRIRIKWTAGAPRLAASVEYQGGRIPAFTREKIWALSDRGRIEPVVDFRFNSKEGRDLIRLVAKQLGLRERLPLSLKLTLVMVLITPAFFAVYGLVQLVLRIAGVPS